MIKLNVFHTQEFRYPKLKMPEPGTGNEMWLGDGFYFWQDCEFAKIWKQFKNE